MKRKVILWFLMMLLLICVGGCSDEGNKDSDGSVQGADVLDAGNIITEEDSSASLSENGVEYIDGSLFEPEPTQAPRVVPIDAYNLIDVQVPESTTEFESRVITLGDTDVQIYDTGIRSDVEAVLTKLLDSDKYVVDTYKDSLYSDTWNIYNIEKQDYVKYGEYDFYDYETPILSVRVATDPLVFDGLSSLDLKCGIGNLTEQDISEIQGLMYGIITELVNKDVAEYTVFAKGNHTEESRITFWDDIDMKLTSDWVSNGIPISLRRYKETTDYMYSVAIEADYWQYKSIIEYPSTEDRLELNPDPSFIGSWSEKGQDIHSVLEKYLGVDVSALQSIESNGSAKLGTSVNECKMSLSDIVTAYCHDGRKYNSGTISCQDIFGGFIYIKYKELTDPRDAYSFLIIEVFAESDAWNNSSDSENKKKSDIWLKCLVDVIFNGADISLETQKYSLNGVVGELMVKSGLRNSGDYTMGEYNIVFTTKN